MVGRGWTHGQRRPWRVTASHRVGRRCGISGAASVLHSLEPKIVMEYYKVQYKATTNRCPFYFQIDRDEIAIDNSFSFYLFILSACLFSEYVVVI